MICNDTSVLFSFSWAKVIFLKINILFGPKETASLPSKPYNKQREFTFFKTGNVNKIATIYT